MTKTDYRDYCRLLREERIRLASEADKQIEALTSKFSEETSELKSTLECKQSTIRRFTGQMEELRQVCKREVETITENHVKEIAEMNQVIEELKRQLDKRDAHSCKSHKQGCKS